MKFIAAVFAALAGTTSLAFAAPALNVPEPGSLALVGVAVAGLVAFSRSKKK